MKRNPQGTLIDMMEFGMTNGISLRLEPYQGPLLNEVLTTFETYFWESDLRELASRFKEGTKSPSFKNNLTEHLRRVSERTSQDPLHLKKLLKFYLGTDERPFKLRYEDSMSKQERDFLFDVEASFKHALGLVHFLTSSRLTPNRYILGIRDDGSVVSKHFHPRSFGEDDMAEFFKNWYNLSCHAPFFMRLNPDEINELVNDHENWARTHQGEEFFDYHEGNFLGRRLFRFGSENKVYASPRPHRIVLENQHFDSITVKDCFRDGILYKVKFANREISVGFMNLIPEELQEPIHERDIGTTAEEYYRVAAESSSFTPYSHVFKINRLFWKSGLLSATVGAIARDMFVCEERTRLYRQRTSLPPRTRENRNPTPTVIWLPRKKIRYVGLPERSEQESEELLGEIIHEIDPSDVPGHVRRCENPSPEQLELANFYGVQVPDGHTFVRPYHRDAYIRRDPIYKSRSALQVLFAAREDQPENDT